MIRRNQHGKVNFGAIVAGLLFLAFVYAMFKLVPHLVNNYELDDFMKTEARFLSYGQRSETEARGNIAKKMQELDIVADDLKIEKNGRRVKMHLVYTVTEVFPGYTFTKVFVIDVDNIGV